MIVDSSALVAIAFREPRHERLVECIQAATSVGIGAPTAVEAGIVLGRRLGFTTLWMLHRILQEGKIASFPSVRGTGPWQSPQMSASDEVATLRGSISVTL